MPQRYKLMYAVMMDHKNSGRLARKPMPLELKQKLAVVMKEYNEFKTAEKSLLDMERAKMAHAQLKAIDASVFLPDYLIEEAHSDSGTQQNEDLHEF